MERYNRGIWWAVRDSNLYCNILIYKVVIFNYQYLTNEKTNRRLRCYGLSAVIIGELAFRMNC